MRNAAVVLAEVTRFMWCLIRRPCFFFFSSRRRHTRYLGDWSSDVCSSDLDPAPSAAREETGGPQAVSRVEGMTLAYVDTRSEERRVGKECRSRGSPDH